MPVLAQCSKIREKNASYYNTLPKQTYSVIPFWTILLPFSENCGLITAALLWWNYGTITEERRTKTIGFCLLIPKPYLDKVNGARAVKGLVVYYVSLDYSDESIEGWIEHTILFLQNVSIKVNIFICLHDVEKHNLFCQNNNLRNIFNSKIYFSSFCRYFFFLTDWLIMVKWREYEIHTVHISLLCILLARRQNTPLFFWCLNT